MNKKIGWGLLLCLWVSCSEPAEQIRRKLAVIVEDDFSTMVGELASKDSTAVLAKPYFREMEYARYPKSRMYTHKAVVEFFYFRTIQMKQVRKYRYEPTLGQWQRYHKKLEYNLKR